MMMMVTTATTTAIITTTSTIKSVTLQGAPWLLSLKLFIYRHRGIITNEIIINKTFKNHCHL